MNAARRWITNASNIASGSTTCLGVPLTALFHNMDVAEILLNAVSPSFQEYWLYIDHINTYIDVNIYSAVYAVCYKCHLSMILLHMVWSEIETAAVHRKPLPCYADEKVMSQGNYKACTLNITLLLGISSIPIGVSPKRHKLYYKNNTLSEQHAE